MTCAQEQPIELAVDTVASAMLAAAIGFALSASAAEAGAIVAAGVAGFASALAGLRAVPIEARRYALPAFELPPIPAVRKSMQVGGEAGELLLEDALGDVGAGARVVQLFHRCQPQPDSRQSPVDASEALSEALAELRRALR